MKLTSAAIALRSAVALLPLLSLPLIGSGCGTAAYTGAEPSARTFREDANPRDYYVGMDFNFAVEDDEPHLAGSSANSGTFDGSFDRSVVR